MIVLFVYWLIGLGFAGFSSTQALNYIDDPRSDLFFDPILPVVLIIGLLAVTLRQIR